MANNDVKGTLIVKEIIGLNEKIQEFRFNYSDFHYNTSVYCKWDTLYAYPRNILAPLSYFILQL